MNKKGIKTLWMELPEGVTSFNFWSLVLLAFLVNVSLPLFHIIQPLWLEKVILIDSSKYGLINSNLQIIMEIVQIVFLGYLGVVSDRIGRRPLLWFGFLLFGVFFYLYGQSSAIASLIGVEPITVVYMMRGINAFLFLLLWPQIITLIADYSFVQNRGRGMGVVNFISIFGAFFSLLFVSQIPKLTGITSFFYIGPIIGFLGFIIAFAGIRDRTGIGIGGKNRQREKKEWRKVFAVAKGKPGLRVCLFTAFAARADQSILGLFLITWAVKVAAEFSKTPEQATAMAPAMMAVNVLVASLCSPFFGYLTDRLSRKMILCCSLFLSGIGYFWMGLLESPFDPQIYIVMAFMGMGVSGITISAQTLTADLAPKDLRGSVLGAYNTSGAVGILFFAFVGGYLFDHIGYAMPFLIKGIADLLALSYAVYNWKNITHHNEKVASD